MSSDEMFPNSPQIMWESGTKQNSTLAQPSISQGVVWRIIALYTTNSARPYP